MNSTQENKCLHLDCEEEKLKGWKFCAFHNEGGVLGNGELFDQYQIIEENFISFIKIIPINDNNHLKVHSPVLRDIIIRSCVQIEIFFKEWAKFDCSVEINHPLLEKYNQLGRNQQPKGERNWNFGDYFYYKNKLSDYKEVYVRPMDEKISPFDSWESERTPPFWWKAYNSIKHSGVAAKKDANLKNALYALGALFLMHTESPKSKSYIEQFKSSSLIKSGTSVEVHFHNFTSPIDSKRYLFKSKNYSDKKIKLASRDQVNKKSRL